VGKDPHKSPRISNWREMETYSHDRISESIDANRSTNILLRTGFSKHMQFLAEYSEAPIQTTTDYIRRLCRF
jgi:hypothetical protein